MNTQRTTRQLASRAGKYHDCVFSICVLMTAGEYICRPCRDTISRSSYSTAAALEPSSPLLQHIHPITTSPQTSYVVNAGVVLSRPPLLTRDLHPFESAFFLYQRRLNERTALPFTRYFYIKKNTPADLEWKRKLRQRLTPARDIGRYKGYGDEAWNDEVLIGAREREVEWQVERLLEDAEQTGKEGATEGSSVEEKKEGEKEGKSVVKLDPGKKVIEHETFERPMPRITEADEKGDVQSLNRQLQRTLYLVVRDKEGRWMFPQDRMAKESLHTVCLISML
jgi:large subunit ribosomal protein L46